MIAKGHYGLYGHNEGLLLREGTILVIQGRSPVPQTVLILTSWHCHFKVCVPFDFGSVCCWATPWIRTGWEREYILFRKDPDLMRIQISSHSVWAYWEIMWLKREPLQGPYSLNRDWINVQGPWFIKIVSLLLDETGPDLMKSNSDFLSWTSSNWDSKVMHITSANNIEQVF